jgi:hypothetical protein
MDCFRWAVRLGWKTIASGHPSDEVTAECPRKCARNQFDQCGATCMKRNSTTESALPPTNVGAVGKAWDDVSVSFERFCLTAGIETLGTMMGKEAEERCGPRHARNEGRRGYRWPYAGQDRLPWWPGRCRTTAGSSARGPGDLAAELGTGRGGRLARAVGDESHAHQRLDAEIRSGGAASGGRCSDPDPGYRNRRPLGTLSRCRPSA